MHVQLCLLQQPLLDDQSGDGGHEDADQELLLGLAGGHAAGNRGVRERGHPPRAPALAARRG